MVDQQRDDERIEGCQRIEAYCRERGGERGLDVQGLSWSPPVERTSHPGESAPEEHELCVTVPGNASAKVRITLDELCEFPTPGTEGLRRKIDHALDSLGQ